VIGTYTSEPPFVKKVIVLFEPQRGSINGHAAMAIVLDAKVFFWEEVALVLAPLFQQVQRSDLVTSTLLTVHAVSVAKQHLALFVYVMAAADFVK